MGGYEFDDAVPASGGATSVSNSDGTITSSPTTGAVVLSRPAITGDISVPSGSNVSTSPGLPNKPQDFGLLGWTVDPLLCGNNGQLAANGRLYLFRFRCVTTGTAGHIAYAVTIAGSVLSNNFMMLYDTGQSAGAGTATLLGYTADQSTNWATAAEYSVALTAESVGSLALTVGQDYFVGIYGNATTLPKFASTTTGIATGTGALINQGLTTTGARVAVAGAGSYTSTIPTSLSSGWALTSTPLYGLAFVITT